MDIKVSSCMNRKIKVIKALIEDFENIKNEDDLIVLLNSVEVAIKKIFGETTSYMEELNLISSKYPFTEIISTNNYSNEEIEKLKAKYNTQIKILLNKMLKDLFITNTLTEDDQ